MIEPSDNESRDTMFDFDYKKLFVGEIIEYNKQDIKYAIDNDIDLSSAVIGRINDYENTFHIVKKLIRFYWGKIAYTIDNPQEIIDFMKEKNPQLFEVDGAEEYIIKQIRKSGYALYEYLQPTEPVKVKLSKKAIKYKSKKEKKDTRS